MLNKPKKEEEKLQIGTNLTQILDQFQTVEQTQSETFILAQNKKSNLNLSLCTSPRQLSTIKEEKKVKKAS